MNIVNIGRLQPGNVFVLKNRDMNRDNIFLVIANDGARLTYFSMEQLYTVNYRLLSDATDITYDVVA